MSATLQSPMPVAVRGWPAAAALAVATVAGLLLIYYPTSASTVAIWERSETFAHGFLIFPISAWLVWRRRDELARLPFQPDLRGLAAVLLASAGWLFAHSGGVLVGEQLMLVAIIPAAVWTLLGARVVRAIAFALGFLFLAVPMGEFLIPHMMEFTADFTVAALQLTGIPVYREGLFFNIPSGDWSVVEGCSGLRYLIASFTLGCLYAYLTYRSTTRRILFALASVIVPVIANGLRAYMIVMIAHLSDMKLALGVDHYIYGWVFFGLVMLLLFWLGSFWREDEAPAESPAPAMAHDTTAAPPGRVALAALLVLAVALTAPAYAAWLDTRSGVPKGLHIAPPAAAHGWAAEATPFTDWRPHYVGSDAGRTAFYRRNGQIVMVYLAYYRTQRQGAELINSQNYLIEQKHPLWSNTGEALADTGGDPGRVMQGKLRAPGQRLLVWRWNRLDGRDTINDYLAKLLLASAKVSGGRDDGAAIVIATPYAENIEEAKPVLRAFVRDMLPAIAASLAEVARP